MYKLIIAIILIFIAASCNNAPESKSSAISDSTARAQIDSVAKAEYDVRYPPDTSGIRTDSTALILFKIQLRSHINYVTGEVSKIKEDSLKTPDRKKVYKRLRSTLVSVYNQLNTSINRDLIQLVKTHTQSLASINKRLEEKNDELKKYASNIEKIGKILGFFADAASNIIGLRTVPDIAATPATVPVN